MDQQELEKLLGREITSTEVTNLTLYLEIASEKLEELLCSTFETVEEDRRYKAREGYSTVFVDIFNEVTSVLVDGEATTDYEVQQFDNLNGSWYNSLIFPNRFCEDSVITVDATWGFPVMPNDLKLVLARLFDLVSIQQSTDGRVKSQRIDDAQVSFNDASVEEQFYTDNQLTIQKYSICNIGIVRHGEISEVDHYGRI